MDRIYGVVCGKSGMGKSWLMMKYIVPMLAKKKPVIILDILGEYQGKVYQGFEDFMLHLRKKGVLSPGVHVVRWKTEQDAINTIRFVRYLEQPVSLVIEEAHVLFTDSDLRKTLKKPLKEITMFGRHHGIDSILCSQRPANIDVDVRSQAQFTVFFRLNDRADLAYAREKDTKLAEGIENLKKTEYITVGNPPKDFSKLKTNQKTSL